VTTDGRLGGRGEHEIKGWRDEHINATLRSFNAICRGYVRTAGRERRVGKKELV